MAETVRIRVNVPEGLFHNASSQRFWGPGEYDFKCEDAYRGWLEGHAASGVVTLLEPPAPETETAPPSPERSDEPPKNRAAKPKKQQEKAEAEKVRCKGVKTDGDPCQAFILEANGYCKRHQGQAQGE